MGKDGKHPGCSLRIPPYLNNGEIVIALSIIGNRGIQNIIPQNKALRKSFIACPPNK